MYAQRTSSAYELPYDVKDLKHRQEKHKKHKELQKSLKKSNIKKVCICLLNLCVVLVLSGSILLRYVAITEASSKLNKMKREFDGVVAQNQQAKIELSRLQDPKKIEEIATNRLSMSRPEKYQIVYINMDKRDFVEFASNTNQNPKPNNVFASLTKGFTNVLAYLQ